MNKFNTIYFKRPAAFRLLLKDTASVVYGRCITDFLWRNDNGAVSMTILTGNAQANIVREHLEQVQGFKTWHEGVGWRRNRNIEPSARQRTHRSQREGLRSTFLSTKAVSRKEPPIRHLLSFRGANGEGKIRYVTLMVARTCVSKTLLIPATTATANVMTANSLISLYPFATFMHHRNFLVSRPIHFMRWTVPPVLPRNPNRVSASSRAAHAEDYNMLRVQEGNNPERSMGDAQCWVMAYDDDGNNIEVREAGGGPGTVSAMAENKWRLRLKGGLIFSEVAKAKLGEYDAAM
ncbi:hypothetical protein HWV62_4864 [Athelia sp. TMB]|nr:hypothetical protein HWV62_4864 [Athelia sp. TMB]